jgi:DNA-binding transcriptional MerR regulator
MSGWLKLHRSLLEWEWYDDLPCRVLFLHLLIKANYQDGRWHGKPIQAGQFVTSLAKLSEETGLSIQQIRTALSKLESTKEVTSEQQANFRIITITKWLDYQTEQQASNKAATSEQQQYKKERKKEEDIGAQAHDADFEKFWQGFPRDRIGNKEKAKAAYLKAISEKRGTVDEIWMGLVAYSQSDEVARGFAKGAAAWLNDDRWRVAYKITSASTQAKPEELPLSHWQLVAANTLNPDTKKRAEAMIAKLSQQGNPHAFQANSLPA